MKKFLLVIGLSAIVISARAQKEELYARSGDKGPYLEHKVVAKENFFSVGRRYNVSPRALADFNKIDMNKGLFIDQKIRIPLNDSNFTQKGNRGTPVYYRAGDKDNFTSISRQFRNVPVDRLLDWNATNEADIKKGSEILVGFLISSEMTTTTIPHHSHDAPALTKSDVKEEKTELKKEQLELKDAEKKDDQKTTEIQPVKTPVTEVVQVKSVGGEPALSAEGFFKSSFEQQTRQKPVSKNATVTAGIFKTTSGWEDAKYYVLMDGVQPGTIVKIINPTNNRVVYAKVLGEMSGIRQNEGMDIRMCNAAASALSIEDNDKFVVKLSY